MNIRNKIGLIGYGNMGSAIAERIKAEYEVCVFDKDKNKTANIRGIEIARNILEIITWAEAIILAVKPQDFAETFELIKKTAVKSDKLFISIAAGITTAYIEQNLVKAPVIRAMPNLPAQVGEGITALSKGAFASPEDLNTAVEIFNYLGKTLIVEEAMMNAVTVVSGSGSAYVCFFLASKSQGSTAEKEFMTQFQEAAEAVGFSHQEAMLLVGQTYKGTISLLEKTGITPLELLRRVASKGGTSEAALEVLRRGGPLAEAIKAAMERAQQLSRE